MCLTTKKLLITGGSQGIGRIIAIELAKQGCYVVINCAHNIKNAQNVVEEIKALNLEASYYQCDVSDEAKVKEMFAKLGTIDILINNARLDPWLRDDTISEGDWFSKVMDVNLKGAFLCSWEFFYQAQELNWGRIVNVASVRSFRAAEMNTIAYSASKLGMHALTRAFAENGAKYNITANTICPGMVVTENIDKRLSKEKKAQEESAIPLGRAATSEEIADSVLFVLKNGYVTGETVNINGGMYYAP